MRISKRALEVEQAQAEMAADISSLRRLQYGHLTSIEVLQVLTTVQASVLKHMRTTPPH